MGIKNLMKVIIRFAPNSIKYKTIEDYRGTILGIDANLMLYKMVYAIRRNGYDLKTNGKVTTHIHATLLKLKAFKRNNIVPVFVFDGVPPKIKEKTLKDRKEFQTFMKKKYKQAVTQDEKKRYYYMKSDITFEEVEDMKSLIKYFGYSVLESPEEADSQLGYMSQKGLIDGIVTDDMDILIFGGNKVLKNFSVAKKKKFSEIDLIKVKKDLGITQKQLIDLGILLGCDYCSTIKGVGPVTAYKMVKEYGNIDNMIKKKVVKSNFNYQKTQKYFRKPIVYQNIKIKKGCINRKGLTKFLKEFNYDNEKIKKVFDQM